jgi:hypothetical protein
LLLLWWLANAKWWWRNCATPHRSPHTFEPHERTPAPQFAT